MYDICAIGHITKDKIINPSSEKHLLGGTAYYFSMALKDFGLRYRLITAVGKQEAFVLDDLRSSGIDVTGLESAYTVYFENIYQQDQDHREQNVLERASPFTISALPEMQARFFHLGPLLHEDIDPEVIVGLASRGKISLDVQGMLRYTDGKQVKYRDWSAKKECLPYVSILKANTHEMEIITGRANVEEGARCLADWGVEEVIITQGSKGSLIYTQNIFYKIPAFRPVQIVDATGCGDTYMAGYLYKKIQGASVENAGMFGAAMATLKLESFGPFNGVVEDVDKALLTAVK